MWKLLCGIVAILYVAESSIRSPMDDSKCICVENLYSNNTILYADNLTALSSITKKFSIQYSYDKPNLDPAYITANQTGMRLALYATDKPHHPTSNTLARNELLYRDNLLENITYSFEFEQFIERNYNISYQFAFMQMFGASGPNILIRWRNNAYQIVSRGGNHNAAKSIRPIVSEWIQWKLVFNLTPQVNGFVKLYRNNQLIVSYNGASSSGGSFRPKFGIYSQTIPTQNIVMLYRKLVLARLQ